LKAAAKSKINLVRVRLRNPVQKCPCPCRPTTSGPQGLNRRPQKCSENAQPSQVAVANSRGKLQTPVATARKSRSAVRPFPSATKCAKTKDG